MRPFSRFTAEPFLLLGPAVVMTLLLAVACGAAATATPAPTKAPQPAAAQPPVPVAPVAAATPVPKAAPTATPVPVAATVNPGKLTWMIAGWANERFTGNYGFGGGNNYARIMQGFLIATNEKVELLPGIATKWEISKDGKTWTFTIRNGAKFHDGKEITAEDVWWTWMHYFGKDASGSALERVTQSSAAVQARIVAKIEQPEPNKVSTTTTVVDAFFPIWVSEAYAHWYGVLPKRPKVHDSDQEAAYDKNPIGSGPMKLVKHVPVSLMAFERFEDYYYQSKNGLPEDRRVRFKSLDLRLVPEEATRVAAIRAGEADITPVSLASRNQVVAGGGRLVFGPEAIIIRAHGLGCWKQQYPCHDKRVRQALDYAIDKKVMQDKLFGGPAVFQVKGWDHVTPSSIGYSPDLDPRPQDVATARKLLADAGYPGGKGFGKLVVNTWLSTATPFLPESAQLAAEFWKRELGLDVEVKVGDESTLKKQRRTEELHGQMFWEDSEARKDAGSVILSGYGLPESQNRVHENPELFELASKTLPVTDPADRDAAFNKLYLRLRDESYHLGMGYVNIPWAVGPRVAAWQPWPMSFFPSNLHGITLK